MEAHTSVSTAVPLSSTGTAALVPRNEMNSKAFLRGSGFLCLAFRVFHSPPINIAVDPRWVRFLACRSRFPARFAMTFSWLTQMGTKFNRGSQPRLRQNFTPFPANSAALLPARSVPSFPACPAGACAACPAPSARPRGRSVSMWRTRRTTVIPYLRSNYRAVFPLCISLSSSVIPNSPTSSTVTTVSSGSLIQPFSVNNCTFSSSM